jgi:hypothetical protein
LARNVGVFDHRTHKRFSDTLAPPRWYDEQVGDVPDDRVISEDTTEGHLLARAIDAEAQ